MPRAFEELRWKFATTFVRPDKTRLINATRWWYAKSDDMITCLYV